MLFKRREQDGIADDAKFDVIDPSEEITEVRGSTIEAVQEETVMVASRAVIGESIRIKGDITGDEDLLVEGSVEGSISLPQSRLTVGSNGSLDASVDAKAVNVEGSVDGDVNANEAVVLTSSAKVQGNIKAPRITIQDGCRFKGMIDMDMEPDSVVTEMKPSSYTSSPEQTTDKHAV